MHLVLNSKIGALGAHSGVAVTACGSESRSERAASAGALAESGTYGLALMPLMLRVVPARMIAAGLMVTVTVLSAQLTLVDSATVTCTGTGELSVASMLFRMPLHWSESW